MREITVRNPLQALRKAGQSVWLDYIHRSLLQSGEPLVGLEKGKPSRMSNRESSPLP